MTWTKKQKLPALHQSGKVKNPDMPDVEQQNYTSTVLKYANLALPFPQLETDAKRVVPAINELYENRTIANPEEPSDQNPLNTVQIAGTVYKIEGGGGGGEYTAGAGIYFTGDNNDVINADAGRFSHAYEYFRFSSDYGPVDGGDIWEPCWEDSGTTVEGHTVYQTNGGTYLETTGDSLCKFTVGGYSNFTIYVKQNPATSGFRYVVFGGMDSEIDLDNHNYAYSCQNNDESGYIDYTYYPWGRECTVQLLYHKAPFEHYETLELNDGQFVDTGTTVDDHIVYKSDAGSYHVDYGSSVCTLSFAGITSLTIYFRSSSESGYDWAYVGGLDQEVSQYYYKSRLSGNTSYTAVTFECTGEPHHIQILYKKDGSASEYDDRAYFYYVVNEYVPTPTNDDRAYAYIVLGEPSQPRGEIFNDYYNNRAIGDNSHAEGYGAKALGTASHAEGFSNVVNGYYAHGEGIDNIVNGSSSHAEGGQNKTIGEKSHAEGMDNIAYGAYSHVEGAYNKAYGERAHAEGYGTIAKAHNSHAEGKETQALALRSHAEGVQSIASGDTSHAEGWATQAKSGQDHSEGYRTIAEGGNSHAEGYETQASGGNSHAEGNHTVTRGSGSHAEGEYSISVGFTSHSEGYYTSANGNVSHTEGYHTKADSDITHVEGTAVGIKGTGSSVYFTGVSSGFCGHIEGTLCGIGPNADYSHVEGLALPRYLAYDSSSAGYYPNDVVYLTSSDYVGEKTADLYTFYKCTVAEGYYIYGWVDPINYPQYWEVIEPEDLSSFYKVIYTDNDGNDYYGSSSVGKGGHAEGLSTLVIGDYGHSEGNQTRAEGISSHAEGYGTIASGSFSHAQGYTTVASGTFSHAEGYYTYSTATGSHAEGYSTYAIGDNAHAEGGGCKAIGKESHAEGGGTVAYGNWSHVEGAGNYAYIPYAHVEGAGVGTIGVYSHTEGAGNANLATYGHVEGSGNKSLCFAHDSHTEGAGNFNAGLQSHIEGSGNQISGEESHLEGAGNKIHGPKIHGEGGGNIAYGIGSHVEGKHNTIVGFGVHAEGSNNLIGTSTNITQFNYGTTYAVGDIVGPNANYVNFNESTSAYLYRCITAPGQIYPGNGVEYISSSAWNSSTAYPAGSVVYLSVAYSGYGYFYCSSDVPAQDVPPPLDSSWTRITNVLSPFKSGSYSGYYLVSTEQELSGGMQVAKVASGTTINAMWEAIPTPHSTHVEGIGNIALGDYQHVGGKYNVSDANKALIIGNGADTTHRSNALTLDWSGNAVISGDLTTGIALNTTAQTVGAAINEISVRVPTPPTTDGNYTLSLTVTNGVPTYTWIPS